MTPTTKLAFSFSPFAAIQTSSFANPTTCSAFNPSASSGFFGKSVRVPAFLHDGQNLIGNRSIRAEVKEIMSPKELQDVIDGAGDKLVIVDYSTTWCGPCKLIAPKFESLSEEYPDKIFLKVIGDKTDETQQILKAQAIRSVPAFHFWKNKEKVNVITGANAEALESAVKEY